MGLESGKDVVELALLRGPRIGETAGENTNLLHVGSEGKRVGSNVIGGEIDGGNNDRALKLALIVGGADGTSVLVVGDHWAELVGSADDLRLLLPLLASRIALDMEFRQLAAGDVCNDRKQVRLAVMRVRD